MPTTALPRTEAVDVARNDGRMQRLFFAWPAAASARDVIMLLDGNAHFHAAVQMARALSGRPEVTGFAEPVIVGIGYPVEGSHDLERRVTDYTPPAAPERLRLRPNGAPWPETGGADRFLDFILNDALAMTADRFGVTGARRTLFGHSFGGLLTLHCVFTRPGAFDNYLACSPSIWFGEGAVLDGLEGFPARLAAAGGRRRLVVSVGDEEQSLTDWQRAHAPAPWLKWLEDNRMVTNATALVERLARLDAPGLETHFNLLQGENHVTAPPVAFSKGLRLALGRGGASEKETA